MGGIGPQRGGGGGGDALRSGNKKHKALIAKLRNISPYVCRQSAVTILNAGVSNFLSYGIYF